MWMKWRRRSTRKPAPMPAAITIIITMTEARANAAVTPGLLRLLAWLSPAFPIGSYAYSHGLEQAVEDGDIADGDTLRDWLIDVLCHGSGRNDAILLRHAHRPGVDVTALNNLAVALAPSRERRIETLDQGTAFVAATAPWQAPRLPDRVAYPIAVGVVAG